MKNYHIKNYNFKIIIYALVLSVLGIFVIGSAREQYQMRQIEGLILGIILLIVFSLIDYSFILNFYWIIYILNLLLLLSVIFFGDDSKGAQRWIEIASIRFQPSELAKVLLILFFAQFISKHREDLSTFKVLLELVALFIPPLILVLKQPDLSTSILIFVIFCTLVYIGGLNAKIIIGILAIVIPVIVVLLLLVIQPDQKIIKSYQQTRILAWLQPDKYSNTEGYQQQNSITAIGSGQLYGKGYKNNEVGSVKNGNFISEPQTDFIYAIIGEELGFLGCISVIILNAFLIIELLKTGQLAQELSGTLICAGVAANIGFQTFMNIAVTTGLMPNTGLPLPFISYGSTSMVSLYIGLGIVLNIGLLGRRYNYSNNKEDFI